MDPRDGSITLAEYIASHWAPGTRGVPKTQGELPLRNTTAAELRAYMAKLETTVSSVDYRRGILSELSSILEAVVDDKRLARNPMRAKSVRWPKAPVELLWGKPEADKQRRKFSLLLTARFGNAVAVNTYTWKPAPAKAGIIPPRARGRRTGSGRRRRRTASACCGTPTPRSCWRRGSPW